MIDVRIAGAAYTVPPETETVAARRDSHAAAALVPRPLDSVLPQTRSLTLGALIGAPAVRAGLRAEVAAHD